MGHVFTAHAPGAAGQVGAFSPQRGTAVPLDERALTVGVGWTVRSLAAA